MLRTGPIQADADPSRLADVSAMLRVMRPLHASLDPVEGRRRLLADLCRLIGAQVGAAAADPTAPAASGGAAPPAADDLPPRMAEVLHHLLRGDSEKQVARRMRLSPHTVHGHVKVLYRRFGVSTRAELLARRLRPDGVPPI